MQTNDEIEGFRERFAGSQSERKAEADAKQMAEKLKQTKISG